MFCFDDFDDTNVYPDDYYEWSQRGADIAEFDCPGMRAAVDEQISTGMAKQIILDYPLGRRHTRFVDIIDLAVFIDTPLDVAMARRILRDFPAEAEDASDSLRRIRSDLTHYLAKARYPYLDTYSDRDASDLILDGWRSLDELKREVLDRMSQEQGFPLV